VPFKASPSPVVPWHVHHRRSPPPRIRTSSYQTRAFKFVPILFWICVPFSGGRAQPARPLGVCWAWDWEPAPGPPLRWPETAASVAVTDLNSCTRGGNSRPRVGMRHPLAVPTLTRSAEPRLGRLDGHGWVAAPEPRAILRV
jgi:hypothetical protein